VGEFLAKLSKKEKIRLGVLAALILGFSIALALILSRVNYEVLYTNLPPAEAGRILTTLEEMGVLVKTQGADTILVPADQVGELRMRLEAEGYNTGELPTDLIDRAVGITSTAQDRDTYTKLQMQAHLRLGIKRMDKISDCLVLLNLQQDSIFVLNPNTKPSTASVLLELKEGQSISNSEAYSIGQFVALAVPGLEIQNIRIVDSRMNLYNLEPKEEDNDFISGSAAIDYQVALRERIRRSMETQVVNLLSPVFGEGHVQASVNVVLNFDKEHISAVVFDPPVEGETSGIVVSMKELYENTREPGDATGVPGTDTNGLGVVEYPYNELGPDQYYSKVLRELNYEINESRSEIEKAQGTIRDLSIAVIIDSESVKDDYTDNVRNLVAQAVGVSGRYISVERLPIKVDTPDNLWQEQRDFERAMQKREWIKTAIICLTVLLLVLLIISFLRTLITPKSQLALAGGQVIDILSPQDTLFLNLGPDEADAEYLEYQDYLNNVSERDPENLLAPEGFIVGEGIEVAPRLIDSEEAEELAEMEGEEDMADTEDMENMMVNLKSESLEQLEKFIERDPQAVAQLLRNWLSDDYK